MCVCGSYWLLQDLPGLVKDTNFFTHILPTTSWLVKNAGGLFITLGILYRRKLYLFGNMPPTVDTHQPLVDIAEVVI